MAAEAPVVGRGLLSGVAPDGAYYTQQLDLRAAGALLTTPGLLWEAALADAAARGQTGDAYVSSVVDAAKAFVYSDALVDRGSTMSALGDMMGESKGQFVHFLGGTDFGKSLMLAKLAESLASQNRSVVLVDGRSSSANILSGLVSAIASRPGWLGKVLAAVPEHERTSLLEYIRAVAARAAPATGIGAAAEWLGKAVSTSGSTPITQVTLESLLNGFIAASKAEGLFPVLIIDEANAALPDSPPEAKKLTRDTLELLTTLTKQERELNVLLTDSDLDEPVRLERLGYKTAHMTGAVVASEVSPATMLATLQRDWGCGPALAEGLVAVYGGNVWRTLHVLFDLAREQADFPAIRGSAMGTIGAAARCVAAARSGRPEMEGLESMLHSIAHRGYVSIRLHSDPRAELVSALNVGGVVSAGMYAPGLPPGARVGGHTLLVAASQSKRLLLAKMLTEGLATSA